MRKVKYGIIGLGWFGEYHGEALAGLPNAEIYALCTRTDSRLQELGKKFGALAVECGLAMACCARAGSRTELCASRH